MSGMMWRRGEDVGRDATIRVMVVRVKSELGLG